MAWSLDEIENSVIVNSEFKKEYDELFAYELEEYEDSYLTLEQKWENGKYIDDQYLFFFNPDYMEWILEPFNSLTQDKRFLELAKKHKINGRIIYADNEGDNKGTADKWEFKDGEMTYDSYNMKDLF